MDSCYCRCCDEGARLSDTRDSDVALIETRSHPKILRMSFKFSASAGFNSVFVLRDLIWSNIISPPGYILRIETYLRLG